MSGAFRAAGTPALLPEEHLQVTETERDFSGFPQNARERFGHYFSYKSQFTSRKHMLFVFHCLSISSLTPSPTPFSYSIVHDFFMKYIRKMILPHITNTEPDTGDHKSPAFTAHAYQVLRSTQAT